MPEMVKRDQTANEPLEVKDPLDRMFERIFDDWATWLPFRLPSILGRDWTPGDMIRVDEFREDASLVVRAELPGLDPDKDVEITTEGGMLHIKAERREEEKTEDRTYLRHEIRYGSFTRTLRLPEGVSRSDVKASYKDGILEIKIPAPKIPLPKKISISKALR